jgi:hypothetical protein
MSGQGIVRGIIGGLDQAAGNEQGAAQMQDANDREREAHTEELRRRIAPHAMAIQGLQQKLSTLDPKKDAAEYNDNVSQIQQNIHAMREIFTPDEKLGAGDWLKRHTTDHLHITNHDKRERDLQKKQAEGNAQDAEAAKGIATGTVPFEQTAEGQKLAHQRDDALALQAEKNAGNQARGANTRPVPYYAGAVNLDTAASMSGQGVQFNGEDGEPYDLTKLPKGSILVPVYLGGGKSYWSVATDKGRYETGDNQRKFEPAVGGPNPNAPTVGQARVPTQRTSSTTDPFGVTSTTQATTTPMGVPAQAAPSAPAPTSVQPPTGPKTKQLQQVRARTQEPPKAGAQQLDENGHIPESAEPNAMLREAANQLLDGMDINKLNVPAKDKQAAAHVAGKFGWEQGRYTPRELKQFKVATAFLQQFHDSPALSVLDSYVSREKIARAMDPNGGMIDRAIAKNLSGPEAEFIRFYNAALGTIQGLTTITRSGRATEASVNRLKAELPSIMQSAGSKDAKLRLEQLFKELSLAVKKDSDTRQVQEKDQQGGPMTQQLQNTQDQGADPLGVL